MLDNLRVVLASLDSDSAEEQGTKCFLYIAE